MGKMPGDRWNCGERNRFYRKWTEVFFSFFFMCNNMLQILRKPKWTTLLLWSAHSFPPHHIKICTVRHFPFSICFLRKIGLESANCESNHNFPSIIKSTTFVQFSNNFIPFAINLFFVVVFFSISVQMIFLIS